MVLRVAKGIIGAFARRNKRSGSNGSCRTHRGMRLLNRFSLPGNSVGRSLISLGISGLDS